VPLRYHSSRASLWRNPILLAQFRLGALENAARIDACLAIHLLEVGPIAHQATRCRERTIKVNCGNGMARGERDQLIALATSPCRRSRRACERISTIMPYVLLKPTAADVRFVPKADIQAAFGYYCWWARVLKFVEHHP
jgi:hypothetical protein